MRRRLLILLSLFVLLMQPVGLLHGLSHRHGLPADGTQLGASSAQSDEGASASVELACLECLAFAALGSALLPELPAFVPLRVVHASPSTLSFASRGGTAAGYHARGPPLFLA